MPDFAVTTAFKATNQYSPVVRTMGRDTKNFGNTASDAFNRASKSSTLLRGKISGIAGSIIKANILMRGARAIWEFGKGAVDLASDLVEVQNVVDTTFGGMSEDVNKFSKTAIRDFGISELQAKQYTGTIGAMIKSSGLSGQTMTTMSKNLAGLTGDFASFYNLPHEQAFQKIRAGISGETEPLKQIGINMNVANLEAFALTQGITKQYKAMTQAEKVTLRYNYLLAKSKDAQGDFAKTLETSYANQKRVFQTMIQQTAATAMSKVLPILTQGYAKLNEIMSKVDAEKIGNGLKNIVSNLISFFKITFQVLKILRPFAPIIITLVSAYILYSKYIIIAAKAQKVFQSIMGLSKFKVLIIAIGSLIGLIMYLYKNWNKMNKTGKAFIIIAAGIATVISSIIAYQKIMIAIGWVKYIIMMRGAILKAVTTTKAWTAAQWLLNAALNANPIGLIIGAVMALIGAIWLLYKNWDAVTADFDRKILSIIARFNQLKLSIYGVLKSIGKVSEKTFKKMELDTAKSMVKAVEADKKFQKIMKGGIKGVPDFIKQYLPESMKGQKAIIESQEKSVERSADVINNTISKISNFNKNVTQTTQATTVIDRRKAPNETELKARKIDFQGRIDIAGAPDGTKTEGKTRGAPAILLELLGAY